MSERKYPILQAKLNRFQEIEKLLMDPVIISDAQKFVPLQREHGGLAKVARQVLEYNNLCDGIISAAELIEAEKDSEMQAYLQQDMEESTRRRDALQQELEDILTAGDAATRGSLILEVRAGTGGDEAALFARDLFEMYKRYIDIKGWKFEVIELTPSDLGGIKEVVFSVTGEGAMLNLQFESGGHRVQRVPETETQGRTHTSAATVAVLPEATEVEVEIDDEDLEIETMRAGGPGGQKVNKTESAVRITHVPTGLVVKIQDEKSQHKNKSKALRVLRSRLMELRLSQAATERSDQRRGLIGSGNRNERIRTYNFPQNRLTDHRIGLTLYRLDSVMLGDLDELIKALRDYDRNERLGVKSES